MTAPSRPNYRHSGARCCATCKWYITKRDFGWVCSIGVNIHAMPVDDFRDWLYEQPEIELDHICDDWKSEVEK